MSQLGSSGAELKQQVLPRDNLKQNKQQNEIFSCFISYSGSASHDGLQNIKEHLAVKYPNIDIIADRLPGNEDVFDVRIKRNDKDVFADRIPGDKIKNQIQEVVKSMEGRIDQELGKLNINFGKPLAECLPADIHLSQKQSPQKKDKEDSGKKEPAQKKKLVSPANKKALNKEADQKLNQELNQNKQA